MSDLMLHGILRMPLEMAMNDKISQYQFYQTAQQALDRMVKAEELVSELDAEIKQWKLLHNDCMEMIEQKDNRITDLDKTLSVLEGEYPEPTINAKVKEFNDLQEAYETGKRDASSPITIHKNKYGEWDFGVSGAIAELSLDDMDELRKMIMVAVGVIEETFHRGHMKRMDIKEEK